MLTAGHWSRLDLKATAIKSCTPTDMWKDDLHGPNMLPDVVDQLTQAPPLRCSVDWPGWRILLARNQASLSPEHSLAHGCGDAALCISAAGVVEFGDVMSDADLAALCNAAELITELRWCDAEQRARLVLENGGFQQRHGSTLRAITGVPYCTIQAFRVDVASLPDTVEELTIRRALSSELVHLSALPKALKVLCFEQLEARLMALDLPPDLELDVLEFRDVTVIDLGVLWGLEAKVKRLALHCTTGYLILASTHAERKACGVLVPDPLPGPWLSGKDCGQLLPRICSHLAQKGIGVWELTTNAGLKLIFGEAQSGGVSYGSQGTVLEFAV
ncbi:hypothetical protein WJX72_004753 [[Myrmecia] bisecta]|uniref:Uncharacterized protein n=1 Tax=[Myrmecia] bisecta TaxID=41462 RepID=A0AAW1PAU0_9CHLO